MTQGIDIVQLNLQQSRAKSIGDRARSASWAIQIGRAPAPAPSQGSPAWTITPRSLRASISNITTLRIRCFFEACPGPQQTQAGPCTAQAQHREAAQQTPLSRATTLSSGAQPRWHCGKAATGCRDWCHRYYVEGSCCYDKSPAYRVRRLDLLQANLKPPN